MAKKTISVGIAVVIFATAASCVSHSRSQGLAEDAPDAAELVLLSSTEPTQDAELILVWEDVSEPEPPYTDEELEALVQTLRGECYDDKPDCKRKVCETICNRVSAGIFGDSIVDVVSAPYQFAGYWAPSRPASENDYEIARQVLEDWYANDCEALSEWLYFVAGENRENVFRSEY